MLTQKLYFYDNDAICDVIMQESVRNGRHNNRHETRMDSLFELPVFYTNSTIFILDESTGAILPFVALPLFRRFFLILLISHTCICIV